jgi:hypothetical protein
LGGTHTGQAGQGWAAGQEAAEAATAGPGPEGCCSSGAQAWRAPASRIATVDFMAGRTMWVIFLEMGVALCLLLFIVWWTWPKKRPGDEDRDKR